MYLSEKSNQKGILSLKNDKHISIKDMLKMNHIFLLFQCQKICTRYLLLTKCIFTIKIIYMFLQFNQ